jgi:hypothetical protein
VEALLKKHADQQNELFEHTIRSNDRRYSQSPFGPEQTTTRE